jgi:hypothetical protein
MQTWWRRAFARDLKFGQEVSLGTVSCEPTEVKVYTPDGPETLSWDLNVNGQLAVQKYRVPSVSGGNNVVPSVNAGKSLHTQRNRFY